MNIICVRGLDLSFELPDNEKRCFYESFTGPVKMIFEYKVLRGGNNDVDASVITPNSKIIYKEQRKSGDEFLFESSLGEYAFCFSNKFSTITHKMVFLSLRRQKHDNLRKESGNRVPFVLTASESSCETVHESMSSVVDYQREYRLREAIGRFAADALNQRVMWWSIAETIILIMAGIGQVVLLKQCFTLRKDAAKTDSIQMPT